MPFKLLNERGGSGRIQRYSRLPFKKPEIINYREKRWKSGEITVKKRWNYRGNAKWSTEINDGNGDSDGEGWSKIVRDGKRQWELVFTALSPHFHCISAFDFLSKNVPKFCLCRWTFISQKKSRPPYSCFISLFRPFLTFLGSVFNVSEYFVLTSCILGNFHWVI